MDKTVLSLSGIIFKYLTGPLKHLVHVPSTFLELGQEISLKPWIHGLTWLISDFNPKIKIFVNWGCLESNYFLLFSFRRKFDLKNFRGRISKTFNKCFSSSFSFPENFLENFDFFSDPESSHFVHVEWSFGTFKCPKIKFWYRNAPTNDIFETKLISNWLFWIENQKMAKVLIQQKI